MGCCCLACRAVSGAVLVGFSFRCDCVCWCWRFVCSLGFGLVGASGFVFLVGGCFRAILVIVGVL